MLFCLLKITHQSDQENYSNIAIVMEKEAKGFNIKKTTPRGKETQGGLPLVQGQAIQTRTKAPF